MKIVGTQNYTLEVIVSAAGCSANIVGRGVIKSPNFPLAYPNNFVCIYNLHQTSKPKLLFNFGDFNLATDQDRLTLYSGGVPIRAYSQIYFRPRYDTMAGTGYLNFTTDSANSRNGFIITVTSIECGTTLKDSGELLSPNYPVSFSGHTFCKWDLVPEPGKIIQLQFASFLLQEYNQFLRILTSSKDFRQDYKGVVDSHSLLLNSPASVIFSSKTENMGGSFRLLFTSVECGGDITKDGRIVSPGYPNHYPDNAKCVWFLREVPGKYVQLRVDTMDLSTDGFDRVELYQRSGWFKSYYGQNSNDTLNLGNRGRVEFYTNVEGRGRGFSITVTFVGSEVTLFASGRLTSPGYPNDYPNSVTFYWHLKAEPGKKLLLELQTLRLAGDDRLGVYMGGGRRKYYKRLEYMPYRDLLDSAALLVLAAGSGSGARGFLIDFSSTECGKPINGSGVIASPGFPSLFTGSAICTWGLYADPGKTVYLEIFDVNLPPSVQSLHVSSTSFEWKFDGDIDKIENYVIALDFTASVTWMTQMNNLGGSFKLNFLSQNRCGGNLSESGFIEAPSYESLYPDNSRCSWNLRASPGKILILRIDTNLYNDNFDRVEVYEGTTLVKTYYGFSYTDTISLGIEGSVVFMSNLGGRGLGFFISFTSEECGGTLVGSGILSAGPAPFEYAANLLCKWSLVAPRKAIQLEFIMLELEDSNDSLKIYKNGTLHSSYFNRRQEKHVIVMRDTAEVIFQSDKYLAGAGFYIIFSSFACGDHLLGPGFIGFTTPDYLYAYAQNVTCKWTLKPIPPQQQVELHVLSVTQYLPLADFYLSVYEEWFRKYGALEMFVVYQGEQLAFSSKDITAGYHTKLNGTVTVLFTNDLGLRNASFLISIK